MRAPSDPSARQAGGIQLSPQALLRLLPGGFIGFLFILAILEQMGMSNKLIGYVFLLSTIALYAVIGIRARTMDLDEYYVVGRRVPAFFNGMATGADWMSAASFIGMAGTLYAEGYDGLAYIMGWTGGYCLVALLLAPYLRKFGQYTIPDFLGARYGGNAPRLIAVVAVVVCSFTYVIAQIYGVGLITSRFTGLEFRTGVYAGLAGILVCSFLGGMRAITWTQVAQYIILIVAYLVPVVWLSVEHTGNPVPQLSYGYALQQVTAREKVLNDPHTVDGAREAEVRAIYRSRQADAEGRLKALAEQGAGFLAKERAKDERALAVLQVQRKPDPDALRQAHESLLRFPADAAAAREQWRSEAETDRAKAAPIKPHAEPFAGATEAERNVKRKNFLALVMCLMVGTAALPHILIRYYTTPSVKEARHSVFWSLFFIVLLYFTAPALAVLAKLDIYHSLVGSKFSELPGWVNAWARVDNTLMNVTDVNKDGIVQLAEITIGPDLIVLATPEIAGLPYVVSGLVAAGGLAAALSTADGLLLTIANALSHDVYYKVLNPNASTTRRLVTSKVLLLLVAIFAAYVASLKPGDILFMVGSAFSLAASTFFPALVLGVFWRRANGAGAVAGMVAGMGTCMLYMYLTYPIFGVDAPKWWDIEPIAAGVFGIPVGLLGVVLGSLLTPAPDRRIQQLVDNVRYPNLERSAGEAGVGDRVEYVPRCCYADDNSPGK